MQISSDDALRSLVSTCCPACLGSKKPRNTLCGRCYFVLSPAVRVSLYRGMGNGYVEAIQAAFAILKRTEFRLPPVKGGPATSATAPEPTLFSGGAGLERAGG